MADSGKKHQGIDFTGKTGSDTDIAPVGPQKTKPAHEKTAAEEAGQVNWSAIADMAEFKALLASRRKFVLPATIFFVIYYFSLPILVGYFPELMKIKIWGSMNIAYVFAFSQFFMAWIIAILYVGAAKKIDAKTVELMELAKAKKYLGGRT